MIVFACRSDGLGERLCSIFNGLLLSRLLSQEFKFFWPQSYVNTNVFHAVSPVEEIFSANFLDKYWVDTDLRVAGTTTVSSDEFISRPESDEGKRADLLIPSQHNLTSQLRSRNLPFGDAVRFAQSEIEFSPKIMDIFRLAGSIDLAGRRVMHLRAGDVIYGDYRFYPHFTEKFISISCADWYLAGLKEAGEVTPLLIGQDLDTLSYLESRHALGNIRDFYSAEDRLAGAFFDIFLMAGSDGIIAKSSSGFPRFAGLYGGRSIVDPSKKFYESVGFPDFVTALVTFNASDEQKFSAAFQYFFRSCSVMSWPDLGRLVSLMLAFSHGHHSARFYDVLVTFLLQGVARGDLAIEAYVRDFHQLAGRVEGLKVVDCFSMKDFRGQYFWSPFIAELERLDFPVSSKLGDFLEVLRSCPNEDQLASFFHRISESSAN